MAAIVTQNDIVKIINASTDNLEVIINTLATAIDKITKNDNNKILKSNSAKMQNICGVVNSYITILNSAIDNMPEFTAPTDKMVISSIALSDAMGVVVLFADSLNNDKLKTIDKSTFNRVEIMVKIFQSLAQIFDSMEKYYNSAFGTTDTITIFGKNTESMVRSIVEIAKSIQEINDINISKNITKTINSVNEFVEALNKLQNSNNNNIDAKDVEKNINSVETITKKLNESKSLNIINSKSILKCIKDVNNIIKELNDSKEIDNVSLKDLSSSTKTIKTIIDSLNDIFKSVSGMIGVSLKIVLFSKVIELAITIVIKFLKSLEKFKEANISKEAADNIKNIKNVIDDVHSIFKSISKMIGLSMIVGTFGWIVVLAVIVVIRLIRSVIKLINSINITDDATKSINNLNKIFNSLHSIMSNIVKMIGLSVIVGLFGWVVILSVLLIAVLAKVIVKIISFIKVSNKDFKKVHNLELIFKGLYDIMKTLIKMIPASILAVVGIIFAIVFVSLLVIVTLTINLLLKVTSKIDNKTAKRIAGLGKVFKSLISVAGAIIFLALIAPVAAFALVMIVIPFLLLMLLVFAIMAVSMFLLRKLSSFSRKQMFVISWNLLLMVGMFIIICIAIVLAATAGQIILKSGAIENIVVGLIGIATMLGIIIGISKLLNKKTVKSNLLGFRKIFPILLQILGLIGLLMLSLILIGETGKYVVANLDNILFGILGVSVVASLVGAISYTIKLLGNKLLGTTAPIITLLSILGLLVLVGLAILAFGEVGEYIINNSVNVVTGFLCMLLVLGVIVEFAIALVACGPELTAGTVAITPLLIILGLIVAAALSIIIFGEVGKYLLKNWETILWGFAGVTAVVVAIIILAALLGVAAGPITAASATFIPLMIILGLMVAAALLIIAFGEVGKYLLKNWETILWGFGSITLLVAIIVALAALLSVCAPALTVGITAVTPLLIILGLMVAAALLIIIFGEVGEYIVENWENILWGFAGVTAVVVAIIALAALLGVAAGPITAASATFIPLMIILGLMVAAALLIIAFGRIGEELKEKSTIITEGIWALWDVIWALVEFGLALIAALVPVLAAAAIASVTLLAVGLMVGLILGIACGVNAIAEIEIDEEKVKQSLKSIKSIISTLASEIKDLLTGEDSDSPIFELPDPKFFEFIPFKKRKVTAIDKLDNVTKIINSIKNIAEALIKIEKFRITPSKESNIIKSVNSIFNIITVLADRITKMLSDPNSIHFDDNIVKESTWWGGEKEVKKENLNISRLDNVSKITTSLGAIADALNDIQKLSINESVIDSKIDSIFAYVDKLGVKIEENLTKHGILEKLEDEVIREEKTDFWGDTETTVTVIENQIAKNMGRVGQMFKALGEVLTTIKALSEIEINDEIKTKIDTNINNLFDYITSLSLEIEQLLNPKVSDIPLVYSPEILDKKFADKELIADIIKNRSEEYSNNLDSVSKMFIAVATILENLDKIKELKFTESTKKDITDKINLIFSSIQEIILSVTTGIENLPSDGLDVTDLDNFSNGLSNLCDVMKKLAELKIDNFNKTKNTIVGFLKELTSLNLETFTNADKVCLTIKSMTDILGSNNVLSLKISDTRLGQLERLNKVIISLSEVTPDKVKRSKELLNDQMKYLDKINKTDITKLQTTTKMIGHMAELSKSIHGNFQGLADTLNEEIAPLLEKLKELLENLNTSVTNIESGNYGGNDEYDYGEAESIEMSGDTDSTTQTTKSSGSDTNFKNGNKSSKALDNSQKAAFEAQIENNRNLADLVGDIYQLMLGLDNNAFGGSGVKIG